MSAMRDAALRYAALGWYVFPLHSIRFDKKCGCGKPECASPGKHPRIKWKEGATCDPVEVEKLWRKWSHAGIGLATGPSGLIVFDLDGLKGVMTFKELCNSGGIVTPITARARTARGAHVFFRGQSPTFSNTETKLDVRSVGGYVVLAPSPHVSGHVYRWEVEPESGIAECPAPLLAYASDSSTRAQRRRAAGGTGVGGMSDAPRGAPALSAAEDSFTTRLGASLDSPDWGEVDRALVNISADCSMDKWIKVGMALHAARDPSGWERWNRWSSRGGDKYKGKEEIAYKWERFTHRPDGVSIRTLFDIAIKHGYSRENRTIAAERVEVLKPSDHVNGSSALHVLPKEFTEASEPRKIKFPDLNDEGLPRATTRNVRVALHALNIAPEYDEFHDRLRLSGQPLGEWVGDLTDNTVFMLRTLVERAYRFDPTTKMTYEAAVQECLLNRFDPVKSYLGGLRWDGTPRLALWMPRYLGVEDSPYARAVSGLSLIAAVRRVRRPGCKFDQIIVLEGAEGKGKSSAIEILAGAENFSDQEILTLSEQRQQEALQGVWLYEIADLAGHHRAEIEKVKAFASRTTDRARPAYGRVRIDRPRRCVFFATTNADTYLKSQTGNRRFWPAHCGRIELDDLQRDRDQLWAEAAHQEERIDKLVLEASLWGAAAQLQDMRRELDPWDDKLDGLERSTHASKRYWNGYHWEHRIFSRDLLDNVLAISAERQGDVTAKRVAYAMRRLGWDGPKPLREESDRGRGYTKRSENQKKE